VLGEDALKPSRRHVREELERRDDLAQVLRLDRACEHRRQPDVLGQRRRGVTGDLGPRLVQMPELALAGRRRLLDMDERRLPSDDRRLDQFAALEEADAGVPVAQHHRVAQQEVEQRDGFGVPPEVLTPDDLERRGGEPGDVVLAVGRVGPDRLRLGERRVVDDRSREQRAVAVEELFENRRVRVGIGAEPGQQLLPALPQPLRDHPSPELPELEDERVVELVEALGIPLVVLDCAGMEADHVEERPVGVGRVADVRDARGQLAPVGVQPREHRVQPLQELGSEALLSGRAITGERSGEQHAVRLVADAHGRQRPAPRDVARKELPGRADVRRREERRQHLLQLVADGRGPQCDIQCACLALVTGRRVRNLLEQRVLDSERLGEPLAVAALDRIVGLDVGVFALEDDVVGGVGIVDPRVGRSAVLGVVGRAPLRDETESVRARVVMGDQRLELVLRLLLVGRET
jgi:hypothetical protein